MPREKIDYSKNVIYKIQSIENEEDLYVGHTSDFVNRKYAHKSRCNNENQSGYYSKVYKMIRDGGGWDCFTMVELYKFPCNNGNEARAEEDKRMHELKANMNERRSFMTEQDIKEYNIKYKNDNREKHKAYAKVYFKKYLSLNKETIYQKKKQKYICVCCASVSKNHKSRHERSKKHQQYISDNP